jgi:hypothetical protein
MEFFGHAWIALQGCLASGFNPPVERLRFATVLVNQLYGVGIVGRYELARKVGEV